MSDASPKIKLLVIDKDPKTAERIAISFKVCYANCTLISAEEGERGLALAEIESPNMIIMDISLTDRHGFDVIRDIRLFSEVPIIVLSEEQDELYMVKALSLGADDYVIKPFNPFVFVATVRAILRRVSVYHYEQEDLPCLVAGNLTVDFCNRQVLRDGNPVHLTPTEYRVLYQLVRNAPKLMTIEALKRHVWNYNNHLNPCTIRKSVAEIRHKIGDDNNNCNWHIVNERGRGYRFVVSRGADKMVDEVGAKNLDV